MMVRNPLDRRLCTALRRACQVMVSVLVSGQEISHGAKPTRSD
jgi:hypothetical protein